MPTDTETKMIIDRLDSQSSDIKALTQSISGLTTVLAKKEVADQNVMDNMRRIDEHMHEMDKRLTVVEKISIGDQAFKNMRDFFIKALITIITAGIVSGAVFIIREMAK
jgi:predicted DNA-binding protein YlxM (UPF0122 family)